MYNLFQKKNAKWIHLHAPYYKLYQQSRKEVPLYGFNTTGGQIPVKLIETLCSILAGLLVFETYMYFVVAI